MELPKAYPDLQIYKMKTLIGNKDIFILGSKESDRSMTVSTQIYKSIEKLIPLVNGENSIEEIQKIALGMNIKIDVKELIKIFKDNGLLVNYKGIENSEIRLVGRKFIKVNIKKPSCCLFQLCRAITKVYKYMLMILMLGIVSIVFIKEPDLAGCFNIRQTGIIIIILNIIFIVLHEIGHMIYAIANQIKIDSIEVRLQLGIMPLIFVKYNGLYFIPPIKRLNLILSGIYMHLFWAMVAFFVALNTNSTLVKAIFLNNLLNIIINLCPYQLSDGYFALCTIFSKHNIRIKTLKGLIRPSVLKNRSWIDITFVIIYIFFLVTTIISSFVWAYELSFSIEKLIKINHMFILIVLVFLLSMQILLTARRMKKMILKG